jgi:hypothetical protein
LAVSSLHQHKGGLQLISARIALASVLVHEHDLVRADSVLSLARQAQVLTPLHVQSLDILLHQTRAYMYDRASDSASVTREVAQLPTEAQSGVRAFIAKQRILDAQDVLKRARTTRARTAAGPR